MEKSWTMVVLSWCVLLWKISVLARQISILKELIVWISLGVWDSGRPEAQWLVSVFASCLLLTLFLPCCTQTHLSANEGLKLLLCRSNATFTHTHGKTCTQTEAMYHVNAKWSGFSWLFKKTLPSHKLHMLAPHSRVFPRFLIDPIFLHSLVFFNVWETSSELWWFISYI